MDFSFALLVRRCAAGLSVELVSVVDCTSHPSGSRRWRSSGEGLRPLAPSGAPESPRALPAVSTRLRNDRLRATPKGANTSWLTADAQAEQEVRRPGRVHSGRWFFQAPILAPAPVRSTHPNSLVRVEVDLVLHHVVRRPRQLVSQGSDRHDTVRLGPFSLDVLLRRLVVDRREVGSLGECPRQVGIAVLGVARALPLAVAQPIRLHADGSTTRSCPPWRNDRCPRPRT